MMNLNQSILMDPTNDSSANGGGECQQQAKPIYKREPGKRWVLFTVPLDY
jgi:hypothetical protein